MAEESQTTKAVHADPPGGSGTAEADPRPDSVGPVVDLYSAYRDYVKHEDDLINNRLNWNFAIQGFLFAAYYLTLQATATIRVQLSQTAIDPQRVAAVGTLHTLRDLQILLLIVAAVGAGVSVFIYMSVWAARAAIFELHEGWNRVKTRYKPRNISPEDLPDIVGGGDAAAHRWGFHAPSALPVVCFLAWAILFWDALRDIREI